MRQGTLTLSQKELQRVTVISRCVQGNLVCQRRGAARPISSAYQTAEIALSARQRSGAGARQPRPPQPPTHPRIHTQPHPRSGAHTLRGLQRSSSSRQARRKRKLLSQPRNLSPTAPCQRHRLPPPTPFPPP